MKQISRFNNQKPGAIFNLLQDAFTTHSYGSLNVSVILEIIGAVKLKPKQPLPPSCRSAGGPGTASEPEQ